MTFLALQKTLGLLAMPAGLIWLLLLCGWILCSWRKQRLAAGLFLGAALLYALAGNVYLGSTLLARLETTIPPVDPAAVVPFDAVFVLGGGSQEDPAGRPEAGLAGDRILLAARLWHLGKARVLVASGTSRDSLRGIRNLGEETRVLWRELGIPDHAIRVVDGPCWITRDEILAARQLQLRQGWHRVALLSSASHLPRAMALAHRAGLEATPLAADWRSRPHPFMPQLLIPQGEGFLDVQRACWEWLGQRLSR